MGRIEEWVKEVTGIAMVSATPLVGGMSSEVYRCAMEDGTDLVLRHIADRDWLAREPGLIATEARVLDLLTEADIPAPRHVASEAEEGLLLMTHMPGDMISQSDQLRSRTLPLAQLATQIARVPLPDDHGMPPWRPWIEPEPQPPNWGDEALWAEAIDAYGESGEVGAGPGVLLHRDLHPLNVLWQGEAIVGVVDWVNACVGHPHAELGHTRWNLAVLVDQAAADAFLDQYLAGDARESYDPFWDIASVLSFLPGPIGVSGWQSVGRRDLTQQTVIGATERFLHRALSLQ